MGSARSARQTSASTSRNAESDRRGTEPHEVLLQALYEREPDLHTPAHDVTELAVDVGERLGLNEARARRAAARSDAARHRQDRDPGSDPAQAGRSRRCGVAFVRQHTVVGERILGASPALRPVGRIVRASHERWDGTGYPDQLRGDADPAGSKDRLRLRCILRDDDGPPLPRRNEHGRGAWPSSNAAPGRNSTPRSSPS